MRAHLPVSIAIFDWSGNVFRLARLGIVSLCAVCVCVVVLSRNWNVSPRRGHCNFHRYDLTIVREAGPVSCPESSNRFRPIGRGTCSHRSYTFVSLVFFFSFFFPHFIQLQTLSDLCLFCLIPRPWIDSLLPVCTPNLGVFLPF